MLEMLRLSGKERKGGRAGIGEERKRMKRREREARECLICSGCGLARLDTARGPWD